MNKPLVNTADCNFVKYCIALHALKQVLLQFIKKQCEEHSYWNLEYIKSTCGVSSHTCRDCNLSSSCQTSASASKCAQNGACEVLFQRIKSQHLNQHPNWSNVRWELLSSSPWQQMKSFITERGYEDVASIEDSGITAFVQICCNHCDVSQLVGEDIRVLKKIVETQDNIFQSETVRYTGEEINRQIQDIKSAVQLQSLNGTPGIQDNLAVLDKLLTEERLIVEDEILARLYVIANLNRSIASLKHKRSEAKGSPNDNAKKICELSFIKRKQCNRLQARFEEVDSCLHQQKQEFKKQEDNLLKHKTEGAKLGVNIPLQSSANGWKSTRASNDSYNMYMQGLQEDIHTDVKDVLNGVDKNGRSLIEVEGAVRTMHSLIRDHIAITQLEHGKLPDLLMKITTVGASNNEALSEELVDAGNGLLNGAQFTDSHKRQLQNALRHLLQSLEQDGNIVNRIGHGCMAIYICCPTVINLIALCEDFLSGKLRLLFQPLEDYLRTLPGREEVAVVVDIFEKDYLNCIMPVIDAVKHKLDIRLQALVSLAFGRNNPLQSTNMRAENEHVEILEDEGNTTIKTEAMSECVTEDGLKDADTNGGVPTKYEDYNMAFKDNSGLDKHMLIHEDIKPLGCPVKKDEQDEDILKILIATDNHLGFVENDPVRGNDSLVTFEEILQKACKYEVDFVLLGGDLFHANKPSRRIVHETIALLRTYCLGDKPVQFKVLSDQLTTFEHCKFPGLNYEDPNLNIAIPVFSIHGKHDDPAGHGHLCALDILHTAGYVNYFGKTKSVDEIKLSPLLFQKGSTKLALYGLGAVSDDHLHRMFMTTNVKMLRPKENSEEWFNMFVLHQKRSHHFQADHSPEHFLNEFLDLVVWGHEHECRIDPKRTERNDIQGFYVTQPGSSIATSLSASETVPKYCGMLEIKGKDFKITKIRLETARQFYLEDIVLKETSLDPSDHDIGKKVESYCRKQVEALLKKAANEHTGNKKQPKLPLIRILVDYSGGFEPFNQHRFGQLFLDRVANPKEMIHFMRKKGKAANKQDGVDGELGDIHVSAACIEDMVNDYFSKADEKLRLQLLSEKGIGVAIKELVLKDERDAIPNMVAYQLGKAQEYLKEQNTNDDVIDKQICYFNEERDLSEKEYTEVNAILEPRAQYGKIETLETLFDDIAMKTDNSKTIATSKVSGSKSLGSRNESSFTRKRGSRGGKGKTSSTRGFRGKRGGRESNAVVVGMQRSIKDSFLLEPSASGAQIPSVRSFQEAQEDTIDLTFSDDDTFGNKSAREKETAVIEPSGKQDNQLVGNIQYDSDYEDDAPARKRTRTHVSGTSAQ